MLNIWLTIAIVLTMLGLERVTITMLTRRPGGREFCRSHWFMHPNGISIMRLPMGVLSILLGYCVLIAAGSMHMI